MQKIIALIPARGGSKSIPKKNLALLNGKPLISYTIEAALDSNKVTEVYTSSDSEDILSSAKQFNSRTIIRPTEFATDKALSDDVILHAMEIQKWTGDEIIVFLQPTSPFRNSEHIDKAIDLYLGSDCKSVVSVCEVQHHPDKCLKMNGEYVDPYSDIKYLSQPRQSLSEVLSQNGAIYIFRLNDFVQSRSFLIPPAKPFKMSDLESIDIDAPVDLLIANALFDSVIKMQG